MLLARKIIFYLFVIIYLFVCPLLILYSFGFIFNPAKKEIIQTGLVYLSTTPPKADILLGKSRYKYKTPTSITELMPGKYKITVKVKGYRLWTHTVSIEAGKAAVFENILLIPIPTALEKRSLLSGTYEGMIPLFGTDILLLETGRRLGDYRILNWKKEEPKPLVVPESHFYNLPVISIFTQPHSKTILIYGGTLLNRDYILIKTEKGDSVIEVTDLFPEKAAAIKWAAKNDSVVWTAQGDYINRLNIETMTLLPRYLEGVKGFGLHNSWIYILDKDNDVVRLSYDKKNMSKFFDGADLGKEYFDKERFYEIRVLDEDIILFLSKSGKLISNFPPYSLLDSGVRGTEYYREKRNLLYWTKDAIYTADFEKYMQSKKVYANGRDIKQPFFAYDGTHILFLDKEDVYLLELAPDGKHHIERIVRVRKNSSVFYSEENGYLYYLDSRTGGLMSIRIVPKENLIFAPFIKEKILEKE